MRDLKVSFRTHDGLLRAIDGYSQILEEEHAGALDADGRRIVSVIRKSTQRMGQLIDDLLRFSRLGRQAMKLAEVRMRPVRALRAG